MTTIAQEANTEPVERLRASDLATFLRMIVSPVERDCEFVEKAVPQGLCATGSAFSTMYPKGTVR
jgi:hypothetical protein